MGTFKKLSILVIIITLCVLLFSCGKTASKKGGALHAWMQEKERVSALATTPIVQDLVERVGREHVFVLSIIGRDMDPHSYEIVKGDQEKISHAQIVFASGLMLEHSASMQYQLHHRDNVIFLGDEVLKKQPEVAIYVDGQLDPHIWMDVSIWAKCVDPIVEHLSQIDPKHKEEYENNGKLVKEELAQVDRQIFEKLQSIPQERRYLVTSHDAFNYVARHYLATDEERRNQTWQVRMKALQGLAPDEQISILQIHDLVRHITQYNIHVLFPESNLSKDSLEKLKEALLSQNHGVALSKETLYGDTLGGKTYIEMVLHNASVMHKCMTEEENL